MLTGIYEVDWASMRHAHGPADDVPALLEGLASRDASERERALDGMYGSVHHQGDVYGCTLACIPFLFELVAEPGVDDRGGIVELLTSIGSIDLDGDEDEVGGDEAEEAANYAMAASAVAAGADVFLGMVADPDRGVRLAVPLALATLHSRPFDVLALLRERMDAEEDEEVRLALVEAAALTALRHGALGAPVALWLGGLAREAATPGLRLAALAQLARCGPDELPGDLVTRVDGLLRELRTAPPRVPAGADRAAERTPPTDGTADTAPEDAGTPEPAAPEDTGAAGGRSAPWACDLLRTLHTGLDDRVAVRTALLVGQVQSPEPTQRIDAVRMAGGLVRAWRGSYEELVRLVGRRLADPEPRAAEAAAQMLEGLFRLAAPAADDLAARVASDPADWVRRWRSGPPGLGHALRALARTGDPRAVPALAAALERPVTPHDLGDAVRALGDAAAPLAGPLRRKLGGAALDEGLYDRAVPLLTGLTALRAGEAAPEVLRVLRGAPEFRGAWLRRAALRALASFGPAAACAEPELRTLIRWPSGATATEAAEALYAVSGDAEAALPVLIGGLAAERVAERGAAVTALGHLGGRAGEAVPLLRPLLRHPEPWLRVAAAVALWEVSGRIGESLPVLRSAWVERPQERVRVADCLARAGAVAAGSETARLLRAELIRVRRHNAVGGGYGSNDVQEDERLLASCRRALDVDGA
ncbi:HEAT repeat domain-containing protein [uncultured Streptomyces sp.]|uniref:HEAT repeat domain-containing protein n=1 Tax=uncultured Streptomyces sp. TaxID=174707 RepID=UPI0026109B5A|nr:HEAT repeat domain-containing protein [uncultured Streptomyces sp.]